MAASLRDQLLPLVNTLRGLPNVFGLRRYAVTMRRRVWSGQQQGEGVAIDYNIALLPPPRVNDISTQRMSITEMEQMGIGNGQVLGKLYEIDQITPRYTVTATVNGVTTTTAGGFLSEYLRLWPYRDQGYVENLVSMVGDDGYQRECVQVNVNQGDPFNYSMVAKEVSRPRSNLQFTAISPAVATVVRGSQLPLACVGTFNGGATSILTTLTTWTSSAANVASVDIYGNVTAIAAGSTTITAVALGITSTATLTVT